jgi:hypothetical protein
MRNVSAYLPALFALLLAGLPVLPASAQELKVSRSPRELGTAVLRELAIQDGKIRFRVDSGGCTDAGSFKVRVRRLEGIARKSAHYQLTIERVRIDECKAMLWDGVEIELDLQRDLGLKGKYTLSVGNPVLSNLLAATVRAFALEAEATRQKLKTSEEGTGPKENVEKFRQKLRDLEAERARFAGMRQEEYPAPVEKPADPASVLEESAGFGPVLPALIREVAVTVEGPLAEGALLSVEGTSKSGPFYHLAGIAGDEYGLLKPGKEYRLQLCLVYRREYFGFIGDYFAYVLGVR